MLVRNLILDKTSVPLLNKVLNVTSLRHRAISNNISNVNTVNYKRKEVDFASYLKAAVVPPPVVGSKTNALHMPVGNPDPLAKPQIFEQEAGPNSTGINGVDVDQEMADLAENHLMYNIASQLVSQKFRALKKSITGQVTG
jgi:flagellar basal-body rod protein FlgB